MPDELKPEQPPTEIPPEPIIASGVWDKTERRKPTPPIPMYKCKTCKAETPYKYVTLESNYFCVWVICPECGNEVKHYLLSDEEKNYLKDRVGNLD